MTVLERIMRDFKFELPSAGITSLKISDKTVKSPAAELEKLLNDNMESREKVLREDIDDFIADFTRQNHINIEFNKEALKSTVELCMKESLTFLGFRRKYFTDLDYGLKLISHNTGKKSFRITKKFIVNPGKELSKWVAESFRNDRDV